MNALSGSSHFNLSSNVQRALGYIADNLTTAVVEDPANTNNMISDDLTLAEKRVIAAQAKASYDQPRWEHAVRETWASSKEQMAENAEATKNRLHTPYEKMQDRIAVDLKNARDANEDPNAKGEASEEPGISSSTPISPHRYVS